MRKENKAILLAMCLGNGHIFKYDNCKSIGISLCHSVKQEDYFIWKVEKLRSILGGSKNKIRYFNNNGHPGIGWSKVHRYFRVIRNWLYNNNSKKITKHILNKLTPESIAIWWMDDGSMYKKLNPKTGQIKAIEGILSTYISEEDNQIIIDYFNKTYNIQFKLVKSKNSFRLRLNTTEARKFADLIKPFMHESMLYKIDIITKNL
jgi:IS1 family transposase